MRDRSDIQQAHDLLLALLLREVDVPGTEPDESVNIAASTLCWVLQHDHNAFGEMAASYFAQTLEALQRKVIDNGYAVRDDGYPHG